MADNSTMSPAWAIYCERLGGWLVDTSYVWDFDVAECAEFTSAGIAMLALTNMHDNYGPDAGLATSDGRGLPDDIHIVRVR